MEVFMAEIKETNIVEQLIIPEVPQTVNSEQLNVYTPVATNGTKGIASYDERHFTVEGGKVRLRNIPNRMLVDVQFNNAANVITFVYQDGTSVTTPLPVYDRQINVVQSGMITSVDFDGSSFVTIDGYEALVIDHTVLNVNDDKYLVLIETKVDETLAPYHQNGHVTVCDSVFKNEQGDLIYVVDAYPPTGRLLILSGWLYSDNRLADIQYDEVNGNITLYFANGDIKNAITPKQVIIHTTDSNNVIEEAWDAYTRGLAVYCHYYTGYYPLYKVDIDTAYGEHKTTRRAMYFKTNIADENGEYDSLVLSSENGSAWQGQWEHKTPKYYTLPIANRDVLGGIKSQNVRYNAEDLCPIVVDTYGHANAVLPAGVRDAAIKLLKFGEDLTNQKRIVEELQNTVKQQDVAIKANTDAIAEIQPITIDMINNEIFNKEI